MMLTLNQIETNKIHSALKSLNAPLNQCDIESAPVLEGWLLAVRNGQPVILGYAKNHPQMRSNRRLETSCILAVDFAAGTLRTAYRLYRLGEPDSGSLKLKLTDSSYIPCDAEEFTWHVSKQRDELTLQCM